MLFSRLFLHTQHLSSDGVIVIGGDFNCTENPVEDRLCTSTEHRPKVSKALSEAVNALSLCDVWRRLHPDQKQYTWSRANSSRASGFSRARLDRFYCPLSSLPSVVSCKISPCSLSDHSAVTLQINIASTRTGGSAYWHFNNSLLLDQTYVSINKSFWGELAVRETLFFQSWLLVGFWKETHQKNNSNVQLKKSKRET